MSWLCTDHHLQELPDAAEGNVQTAGERTAADHVMARPGPTLQSCHQRRSKQQHASGQLLQADMRTTDSVGLNSDLGIVDSSTHLTRRNTRSDNWFDGLYTKYGINRLRHWKKGYQRNTLLRSHAQLAVDDIRLVEAFSKDCTQCQVTTLLC